MLTSASEPQEPLCALGSAYQDRVLARGAGIEGRELAYRPVAEGNLHGKRPPKLARLRQPQEMRIRERPGPGEGSLS